MNILYAEGHKWRNMFSYVLLLNLKIKCSSFSWLLYTAQFKLIETTLSLLFDLLIALLKTGLIMSS